MVCSTPSSSLSWQVVVVVFPRHPHSEQRWLSVLSFRVQKVVTCRRLDFQCFRLLPRQGLFVDRLHLDVEVFNPPLLCWVEYLQVFKEGIGLFLPLHFLCLFHFRCLAV